MQWVINYNGISYIMIKYKILIKFKIYSRIENNNIRCLFWDIYSKTNVKRITCYINEWSISDI